MEKVSPCHWKTSNGASVPNHARASGVSLGVTLCQPISLAASPPTVLPVTTPPKARLSN
jgi:hypothetical protein